MTKQASFYSTPQNKSTILQQFRDFLVHLRLKFNIILVPLFIFGAFVAEGDIWTYSFWLQFIILHIFLYGGANALNSYYDKDDGPIGGLKHPPKVTESLFWLACVWKLVGFLLAVQLYHSNHNQSLMVPESFLYWYLAGVIMSVAYSHPAIRLKGSPIGSVLTVSIMQGFGAYCAGWIASGVPVSIMFHSKGLLGAMATQLMATGMYPLTQLYQIEQDRKNGVPTLSVVLGVDNSFRFALLFIFLAGTCLSALVGLFYHWWQAFVLSFYLVLFMGVVHHWGKTFNYRDVDYNFRMLHMLSFVHSACLFMFTVGHLTGLL